MTWLLLRPTKQLIPALRQHAGKQCYGQYGLLSGIVLACTIKDDWSDWDMTGMSAELC